MLIPDSGSVSQFARKNVPTVYRLILLDCALNNNIILGKHNGSASFPTSLLPWFLNCDWQGGSVFPSTHPPLEHGRVEIHNSDGQVEVWEFWFQNKTHLSYFALSLNSFIHLKK